MLAFLALTGVDRNIQAADSTLDLTATLASEYAWRGTSLSERKPSLQFALDYSQTLNPWLDMEAGLWAYSTRYRERPELRLDSGAYFGLAGDFGQRWRWSAQMLNYHYPRAEDWDYRACTLQLARTPDEHAGSFGVVFEHSRSNDVFGTGSLGRYFAVAVNMRLPHAMLLTLHAGRSIYQRQELAYRNFNDYKIALGGQWQDYAWETGWIATSGDQFGRQGKGRAIVSLSRSF